MRSDDARLLVNLGCGTDPCTGWVNIDRSPGLLLRRFLGLPVRPSPGWASKRPSSTGQPTVRRCDATRGLPFSGSSVDAIYSSHMLEHLSSTTEASSCLSVVAF